MKINKHEDQRNNRDTAESCTYKKIYLLHFVDGKFYHEKINLKVVDQDAYLICHDIIADVFFEQLNNNNSAYTSSSSIAGHHNMDESGTLIFWHGRPYYVTDEDEEFLIQIEEEV